MALPSVYEHLQVPRLTNGDRRLTDDEWNLYNKITEDSEGFESVNFPTQVFELGLITPVRVCEKDSAREYEMYKKSSQAALDVYNRREDTHFQFERVLKANVRLSQSCTFYLTFQARDTITLVCENFQAEVHIFMEDTPDVLLGRLEAPSSVNLVPDPVFAQWKPSERILALTPEQEYLTDPVRVQVRKASSSTAKEAEFFPRGS